MLHGRDVELGRLARLLDDAAAGRAGSLAVLGDPGAGKSALLDELPGLRRGFQVLRTRGLESEAPLAFAALQRLLRPVQGLVDDLPGPQAHALRVAFGLDVGSTTEPFLIALATVSLLAEAAADAPVLCLVDDAHWLDAASRDALLFAARRLTDEQVAIVFGARTGDGPGHPWGLDALLLGGLDEAAAATVLAERSRTALRTEVVQALVARTGGNPLALVELPTTLTAGQLTGAEPLPDHLPLTQAVERSFLDRVRRLSEPGQTALLVAAADDSGRLRVVRDAARHLGASDDALAEAERAGLLQTHQDTISVLHPLVRSATYQAATSAERRTAHRALAAALAGVGDPDRRAWHLAASVDGPDTEAAAALRVVAGRAERRGGHRAAAAAFDRAAVLTADAPTRARLLLDAARNSWLSGQAAAARDALQTARDLTEARVLRADIDRLRARLEVNIGSAATAHRILTDAARAVAADDPERALEMAVAARVLRVYDPDAEHELTTAEPVIAAQASTDSPRVRTLRHILDALTAEAHGDLRAALARLRAAVATDDLIPAQRTDDVAAWSTRPASEPDIVANLGNTATHLGDDETAHACYTRVLTDGRHTGAVTVVLYALPRLAFSQLLMGRWDELRHGADEAVELASSIGQPALAAGPCAWLALLAALQGDPSYEERSAQADVAGTGHLGVLKQLFSDLRRWAAATAAANTGDHAEALHQYAQMRVPALRGMTAVERITATDRAGDPVRARAEVDRLAAYATASQLPWALAAAEHTRALLAPTDQAVAVFERALVHHDDSSRIVDRARTQLAYGELLRRTQQRSRARALLRAALATFEDVGAVPLAARAAGELRASGETPRKRDPSTLAELTPMEVQVARLVAQGLSNKDVATQLWISPRTVAFHLRGVFAKLGVSARGQLAQVSLP